MLEMIQLMSFKQKLQEWFCWYEAAAVLISLVV
jgi:hypothetical protein